MLDGGGAAGCMLSFPPTKGHLANGKLRKADQQGIQALRAARAKLLLHFLPPIGDCRRHAYRHLPGEPLLRQVVARELDSRHAASAGHWRRPNRRRLHGDLLRRERGRHRRPSRRGQTPRRIPRHGAARPLLPPAPEGEGAQPRAAQARQHRGQSRHDRLRRRRVAARLRLRRGHKAPRAAVRHRVLPLRPGEARHHRRNGERVLEVPARCGVQASRAHEQMRRLHEPVRLRARIWHPVLEPFARAPHEGPAEDIHNLLRRGAQHSARRHGPDGLQSPQEGIPGHIHQPVRPQDRQRLRRRLF